MSRFTTASKQSARTHAQVSVRLLDRQHGDVAAQRLAAVHLRAGSRGEKSGGLHLRRCQEQRLDKQAASLSCLHDHPSRQQPAR